MSQFQNLVFILIVAYVTCAPAEDLIVDLPGLDYAINFNQYSGYLNGTEGTHLHYWFVESQNDPANDPVLLWLNGGPGCSSMLGMLTENGPFRVNDDGATLADNPYAWNKVSNMIFLESPPCVGFSYEDDDSCQSGDIEAAQMNYLALQDFFLNKFPEYMTNEFFVTGESYGGIYVPTLSVLIVDGLDTFPMNFVGFAIGNGLLSYTNNDNSLLFYGYYHALFGQELWDDLISNCCVGGVETPSLCDFSGSLDGTCQSLVSEGNNIIYSSGLNFYNLYGTCDEAGSDDAPRVTQYSLALDNLFRKNPKITRPKPYSEVPCLDDGHMENYLNTASVRTALHIPEAVIDFTICSTRVSLFFSRDYDSTTPQLAYLQPKVRGLIFNGDTDMSVNFLGNIWDIATLNLPVAVARAEWKTNNDVAGYVIRYENLDFVTVRGSGHMVPQYRPMEALQMITAFINNESY